jgi:L-threonylcarbamoyladenylate synthase
VPILRGDDAQAVDRAARELAAGGLVAFATETVYGLGARADDDAAVDGIFRAKGRPADHPLIVHVVDAQAAQVFAEPMPAFATRLMAAFWPGPVTLVVPRRPGIADVAAGGRPTVGLRCPDHPVARSLLHRALELGVAGVAAPSANRFGRVSPTRASHVESEFGPDLLVLDGGACREGIESTIVDCTRAEPYLLRPGTVSRAAIESALGRPLRDPDADAPRVSGSLESHYAPHAEVRLASAAEMASRVAAAARHLAPGSVGVYSRAAPGGATADIRFRAMPDNAAQVAHELFAVLRQFDIDGVSQIWVEMPPDRADWDGVRDRLRRSAASR